MPYIDESPFLETSEGSDADMESVAGGPNPQKSPVRASRTIVSQSGQRRSRRASSADTIRSSGLLPTGDLNAMSASRKSQRDVNTASSDEEADRPRSSREWCEPEVALPTRDNLALRPTKAQQDFLRRKQGYNGFYHQQSFDTGVEPYGYPDKELPAFRGGEMPDRMSWTEWQWRQNKKRTPPKKSRLTEDLGDVGAEEEGVEVGSGQLMGGRRRTTRGVLVQQGTYVDEPVIEMMEDAT